MIRRYRADASSERNVLSGSGRETTGAAGPRSLREKRGAGLAASQNRKECLWCTIGRAGIPAVEVRSLIK